MLVRNASNEAEALEVEGYKIGKDYFAVKLSDGWSFVDIASGLTVEKSLSTWRACRDYFKGMSESDAAKLTDIRKTKRYEKARLLVQASISKS